jgi:class 3 adenylate cyclase
VRLADRIVGSCRGVQTGHRVVRRRGAFDGYRRSGGAERWREILSELVNRSAAVVRRYGRTVGSFTGDGIMAVLGAPIALEDHAVRACRAALEVQQEADRLADEVQRRDGMWRNGWSRSRRLVV